MVKNKLRLDDLLNNAACYAVTWHLGVIKTAKTGKTTLSVAVCSFSANAAAFISVANPNAPLNMESLKTLLVHDVYIGEECEAANRCFNLKCPKNKAIIESFKEYGIESREKLERVHAALERIVGDIEDKIAPHGSVIYYEKPIGTLRWKKRV